MYIIYKRIDSLEQLKEIEKTDNINLVQDTGYVHNYFIGKYYRSGIVNKLPKGRRKEIEAETFGFENGKYMFYFTKIRIISDCGYKKEDIKRRY